MYHEEEEEEEEERESGSSQSSATETPLPPPLPTWLDPLYQMTSPASTCQGYSVDVPSTSQGLFVPTVTAITTSQDLQWMVQSTVITSSASSHQYPRVPPPAYVEPDPAPPGPSWQEEQAQQPGPSGARHQGHQVGLEARSLGGRRRRDEDLSAEEAERRRVRRERNKQAAARCRNRRRELTDRLQSETDELEDRSTGLRAEIETLSKEKERLQLVLAAHKGFCKIAHEDDVEDCALATSAHLVCVPPPSSKSEGELQLGSQLQQLQQQQECAEPSAGANISGSYYFDFEPIAGPSSSASSAATAAGTSTSVGGPFPSTSGYHPFLLQGAGPGQDEGNQAGGDAPPPPQQQQQQRAPGSSNGEQSSDSLSSPTLLAL
ncbi:fos-related antigen 2-like [Lethenteron reissneri]|uniref:fos-related antigen 2-like n=1 Tax=Lethenteron reissneri TaxID=7753 RepID=UPI002AB724AC|nr:fos-related antigen 2-like [Lethenteron reissneri]